MTVVALVDDLLDRSRVAAALPDTRFVRDPAAADAEVVVIDLAGHAADVGAVRARLPHARIVAFGSHVEADTLEDARVAGADVVLPRSRFFRDPLAAVASPR